MAFDCLVPGWPAAAQLRSGGGARAWGVSATVQTLGIPASEVEKIYYAIDDDGNGTISKQEFAVWWFSDQSKGQAGEVNEANLEAVSTPVQKITRAQRKQAMDTMWQEQMRSMGLSKN